MGVILVVLAAHAASCQPRATEPAEESGIQQRRQAADANLRLAVAYMGKRDLERAKDKLDKALEFDPHYGLVHMTYGLFYDLTNEEKKAERSFAVALSKDRENADILNNYGQFLCNRDRIEKAEETFLKAARNPVYRRAEIPYTNLANCVLKRDQVDDAERYLANALRANPNFSPALLAMAELHFLEDRVERSFSYMTRYEETGAIHNARSAFLGYRLAVAMGDKNKEASYRLLLRNKFPDSLQTRSLDRQPVPQ